MKKLTLLILLGISTISLFAQNAAVQNAPVTPSAESFWNERNLWILFITAVITGFILFVMYALSAATISLSKQVEKKVK